ncbi:MAG: hypothetical protein AMJ94_10345 [Deltaproteobacteria bacterium SM23_61]|nr:MAG: hypothetical protein AMJ94_10345 [Deltaproteobacteria bacterium SM23_61]
MKKWNWRIWIGFFLVVLSAVVYIIHFLIFRDSHHIFIFLVADIGFVFIEVLLVTLIIDQLLHQREKRSLLHKLNMIIGVFFSEGGSELLRMLSEYDPQVERIRQELVGNERWNQQGFSETSQRIRGLEFTMDSQKGGLEGLRDFLKEKKDFFLRILENPNLLEHEKFTDILWAVLHLAEELTCRRNLQNLPRTDYAHLAGDMGRAYKSLISGWLDYMLHLKTHYPYLFSLAIRTNPFDPKATPEVTE